MGWLTAVEERQKVATVREDGSWLIRAVGRASHAGVSVTESDALSQTAVWAGVNRIANDVARVPLKVYSERPDGGKDEQRDHHLWPMLNGVAPNPEMTSFELRQMLTSFSITNGNGIGLLDRRGGRVSAIWPIPPWRVTILRNPSTQAREYWVRLTDGRTIFVDPEDIWHIRGFLRDGLLGENWTKKMREAIGVTIAAERSAASFFGNGAALDGVLKTDQSLSETAYNRATESWERKHEGPDKHHRVALLEEGLEFQAIMSDPESSQLVQARKFQVNEVARALNLPPHKIGDLERSSFNNIESQEIDYVVGTLGPHFTRIEQRAEKDLLLPSERRGITIEHVVEGLLRGDSQARSQFYREMFGIGGFSINDILRKENMNPVEGGDQRFVPLNMIPLEEASQVLTAEASGGDRSVEERAGSDVEARQRARTVRAVQRRKRVERAQRRGFREAFERMVRREVNAGTRALDRAVDAGEADLRSFRSWVDEFYDSNPEVVEDALRPVFRGFAESIHSLAADEIGNEPAFDARMERLVDDYVERVGRGWSEDARRQLRALLREHPGMQEAEEALRERFEEWEERRPAKSALRTTVDGGSLVAAETWAEAGVPRMEWVAVGESCPLCENMDGRTVATGGEFVPAGGSVEGNEETGTLQVRKAVSHPQLHGGCDCSVAPAR